MHEGANTGNNQSYCKYYINSTISTSRVHFVILNLSHWPIFSFYLSGCLPQILDHNGNYLINKINGQNKKF